MNLFYFFLLVSSLIFVHELGHFMVAKAFGVKVLTFSLGFGPKILRFRGRETEYCISLLPLGGYVSMLEESKADVVHPEDRKRTFESLPVYKRLLVVLAGPMMNLVFPVLLYFAVFVSEGPFLPPTVGVVLPGHAADGKLKPGDRVMAINGEEIGTFDELKGIVAKSPGATLVFRVFRNNRHVDVEVVADETIERRKLDMERRDLDITNRVGTIGVQPSPPAAVIGVPNPDAPAYRAGLRTFDVVMTVAGMPVRRFMDLEDILEQNRGETVPVTYLRPASVPRALGGLADMAVFESGVVALTPDATGEDLLARTGLESADLYAAVVPEDTYFYKAGLRAGDRLLNLDGETLPAWSTFIERMLAEPDRARQIEYRAALDAQVKHGTFQMRREDFTDSQGQSFAKYVLRMEHWVPLAPENEVEHPSPVGYAFGKAVDETVDVTRFIMICIVRLAQGRLSLDSLSGPITIYEVAGEEGRKGPDFFVWAMAVLSINLGLLNLLPVPVLDGGHLVFFAAEAVTRRTLPLRFREVAHIVGMALLVLLVGFAFKNDVEKRWELVRGQVRELLG